MQKEDNPHQPLGFCQRIFNFFVNSLSPRGLKLLGPAVPQVTADYDHHHPSRNEVGSVGDQQPISLSLEKLPKGEEKRDHLQAMKDDPRHEIQVHFKQADEEEELEYSTAVDKLGSSVLEAKKDSPSKQRKPKKDRDNMSGQQPVVKGELNQGKAELPLVQANVIAGSASPSQTRSKGEMEPNSTTMARGKGPKKAVSIKDGGTAAVKNKGKEIAAASEEEQEPKKRFPMHLISVASNINEKSDEFIKVKKEKMKNFS